MGAGVLPSWRESFVLQLRSEELMGKEEDSLILPSAIKDDIIQHSLQEWPLEACGIISSSEQVEPSEYYPARNEKESSQEYSVHPQDLFKILTTLEKRGEKVWAVFHSHPGKTAYPSSFDIKKALRDDIYYLIAWVERSEVKEIRAFKIIGTRIEEKEIEEKNRDDL